MLKKIDVCSTFGRDLLSQLQMRLRLLSYYGFCFLQRMELGKRVVISLIFWLGRMSECSVRALITGLKIEKMMTWRKGNN